MSIWTHGELLLDDGDFFVEHHGNNPAVVAHGLLMRRCAVSRMTPEGAECVGGYYLETRGNWRADITVSHDTHTGTDCRFLGSFSNRLDAIYVLWRHRHETDPRQPRY